VGQTTLAIGSPFGERWTLTTGIISALERSITGLSSYRIGAVIQTDAAINPGNSGGPLLSLAGEVIGVNSQIATEIGSNSGIGFAVPSNLVVRVAQELINSGRVNYAYMGIDGVEVNLDAIEYYGLPNNLRGLVLTSVPSSGPAGLAGLQSASNNSVDVITAIDGMPVYNFSGLVAYLAENTRPGQTVNVTVLRAGQTINVPVVLAERP
jgi:S1-C subfamily serine protease